MAKIHGTAWALGAAAAFALGWCAPALARGGSLAPPAGQLPATAPGGTQGLAGPRNVNEAIEGGHAYRVTPYGLVPIRRRPPGYYGYGPYGR